MPFVYTVGTAGVNYGTHATPATEDAYMALRQVTRGFNLTALFVWGKGAGLTALSGIGHHWKRWTTVGSGGTTLTPSPKRIGTTATTTAHDKQTALTPGTVSGAIVVAVGHGAAGPGGWVARDEDSKVHVEAGSSDELAGYSICGTTAMNFSVSAEIEE